ncbi:hypothetical protein C8R31_102154 [Nitrosospira sp. Nsp2]|uniref:hypothetical protein n=1 Tax=Nitrosospira sp. Nsp2 TaxID=136548 RepID=UPI000D304998|nr:hypothetical protein [Nitrosospira sp. Nsp2]PTR16140.1 hypothetical protein C8R31_102154 [Nitrosospira sp. Nsp2]
MKNMTYMLLATSTAIIFSFSPLALAEESPGLVRVDIRDVAKNIAKNINVDVSRIPDTVEIPPGVATGVCQVKAETLWAVQQGHSACAAKMTTPDLDRIIYRRIKGETR